MANLVDEFAESATAFLLTLRDRAGFDAAKFQETLRVIERINVHYANSEMLPKTLVANYLDFFAMLEGSIPLYDETVRDRLIHASATVHDLIFEGL